MNTRTLSTARFVLTTVAALLALPNVLWQAAQGWPMLELLHNGQLHKNTPFALGSFFSQQVLMLGPLAVLTSLAGAVWLLRAPQARPFRALALGLLTAELLFVLGKAKVNDKSISFDELMGQQQAGLKNQLLEAQRAWLKFRDLNCASHAGMQGGTMSAAVSDDCHLSSTAARARELESAIQ